MTLEDFEAELTQPSIEQPGVEAGAQSARPGAPANQTVVDDQTRISQDAGYLREAQEGIRSLQFFLSAMGGQAEELESKLGRLTALTEASEFSARLSRIEGERNAARAELSSMMSRLEEAEREKDAIREESERRATELNAEIDRAKQELELQKAEAERQRISFADHHAAKQEIARLRAELEMLRQGGPQAQSQQEPAAEKQEQRRKRFGRS